MIEDEFTSAWCHFQGVGLGSTAANDKKPSSAALGSGSSRTAKEIESKEKELLAPQIDPIFLQDGIPKFLQYEGKIQNLFLTKWETESCVNDIWNYRLEQNKKRVQEESFGFAHDFNPDLESDSAFQDFFWEYIDVNIGVVFLY